MDVIGLYDHRMNYAVFFGLGLFFVSLGIAGAQQVFPGDKFSTQWWVLTSMFIPGVVFLLWGSYQWLKGDPPAPSPDLDIDEFVCLWLGYDWHGYGSTNHDRANRTMNGTHEAMDALVEAARLGKITVWGRKGQLFEKSHPLSPIPAEAWDRIRIDALEFLSGKDTHEVIAKDSHAYQAHWGDIHLSRTQVRHTWPKIARKCRREKP